MSIINFDVPNDDFKDNEEYVLGMPCENAILDDHDDTPPQESPIVFLNSCNHTIEEKYACVEKYLCVLQIFSAYENLCCNHDIIIDNGTSHYLEIGEHAIDFHDNSNDPFYVKIRSYDASS
jgi:hypothetical protein